MPMFAHLAHRVRGRHLYAAGAGHRVPECRQAVGITPWPCSTDSRTAETRRRRTGPGRAPIVADEGWQQAIEQLAGGRCTLLGLWGDARARAHGAAGRDGGASRRARAMPARRDTIRASAVRHPPAIRLERAIRDLFGLQADRLRPTRGPGSISASGTSRIRSATSRPAQKPQPYAFLPVGGRGPASDRGRAGPCRHHRARPFPLHRQWRARGAARAAARLCAQGHRVADGGRDARRGGQACWAHLRRQHGRLCLRLRAGRRSGAADRRRRRARSICAR